MRSAALLLLAAVRHVARAGPEQLGDVLAERGSARLRLAPGLGAEAPAAGLRTARPHVGVATAAEVLGVPPAAVVLAVSTAAHGDSSRWAWNPRRLSRVIGIYNIIFNKSIVFDSLN
jgi:hypothetical protein